MSRELFSLKANFEVGAPDYVLKKINKNLVLIGLRGLLDGASNSRIEYTVTNENERLDIMPDNGLYVSLRKPDGQSGRVIYLLGDDYNNDVPIELVDGDEYTGKVYDVISGTRDLMVVQAARQAALV